jgi:D-specific alpha-keto acid dehydrogenase
MRLTISSAYGNPDTWRQRHVGLSARYDPTHSVTIGRPHGQSPVLTPRSAVSFHPRATGASGTLQRTGITIYECGQDEAALFRHLAPRFCAAPTITEAALSVANIELAIGNRCVSISHKTQISGSVLRALGQAGVKYVSTRSVGYNHIDLQCAARVGIAVENVAYSPDSVADYTVMLMLMLVRHAKSTISRAQIGDYRLNDVRAKELRDMTVGVVGTGRIGAAVVDRLRGFGCRVLAYDRCHKTSAEYVTLGALLQQSNVVTLHMPLTQDTHRLLDRRRVEQMPHGSFIINTARGSLLDTEALLAAVEGGHLAGAALDVLEGEEGVFYSDHSQVPIANQLLVRLQALPNVLITPHTAFYTEHALTDIVENTFTNCLRFEERAS